MIDLVVAALCAAIGLVALPLAFSGQLFGAAWSTSIWLAAGIFDSIYLLLLAPRFSRQLVKALERYRAVDYTPSQMLLLARLLVLGIVLVLVQAILRRPLALLVGGGERGAAPLEAAIAATALTVLLALLVWLYQTARPLAHSMTLQLIDAAIPTVGAAPLAEPTRTVSVVTPPTAMAAAVETDATVASPRADEPTLRVDPDVTIRSDPDATLRAEDPPR